MNCILLITGHFKQCVCQFKKNKTKIRNFDSQCLRIFLILCHFLSMVIFPDMDNQNDLCIQLINLLRQKLSNVKKFFRDKNSQDLLESNNIPTYYIAVLTIVMMYILSLVLIYFMTGSLLLLTTFIHFSPPTSPQQTFHLW